MLCSPNGRVGGGAPMQPAGLTSPPSHRFSSRVRTSETQAVITYLWIAIGGALGSMARYASSNLVAGWLGGHFPWGTLFINVLGSLVIGIFAALTGPGGRLHLTVSNDARLFVMIGICGGYTTFSSFSLQTLDLIQAGAWLRAGLNVVGSVVLCLIAVYLGYLAAVAINAGKAA